MFTSLDLLVIVVMALAAASLLAVCLMFLIRNRIVKRVCCCIAATLAMYAGYVGIYIGLTGFPIQAILGVLTVLTAIGAVVLEFVSKGNKKLQLVAHIGAAAALVVGLLNAIM